MQVRCQLLMIRGGGCSGGWLFVRQGRSFGDGWGGSSGVRVLMQGPRTMRQRAVQQVQDVGGELFQKCRSILTSLFD